MVELPQVIVVLLGSLSTIVIQLTKRAFKERLARLGVAVFLSGVVGGISFLIAKPPGLDVVDSIAWVFAASQLVYQFFKGLHEKICG